jgi:hypothetical protein
MWIVIGGGGEEEATDGKSTKDSVFSFSGKILLSKEEN